MIEGRRGRELYQQHSTLRTKTVQPLAHARKPAFGSVKALGVSQRAWSLHGDQEPVRPPPLPTRERGIRGPAVVARVQLHRLKLPGVVIKAALGRQAFGVEDIRPVRVTPAGSSDVDCHNGYSVIREQIGIAVRDLKASKRNAPIQRTWLPIDLHMATRADLSTARR